MKLLFSGLFFVLLMQGCSTGEDELADCKKLEANLTRTKTIRDVICSEAPTLRKQVNGDADQTKAENKNTDSGDKDPNEEPNANEKAAIEKERQNRRNALSVHTEVCNTYADKGAALQKKYDAKCAKAKKDTEEK